MSILAKSLKKEFREQAIIVQLNKGEMNPLKSKWKENRIIAKSNVFGEFTIAIDSIKPLIKYNDMDGKTIEFTISDKLSGISDYRGEINGQWVLMEYDFKTNRIKHTFENEPTGRNYRFKLDVLDNVKNQESISINFIR